MNSDRIELAKLAFAALSATERRAFLDFAAPAQPAQPKTEKRAKVLRRADVADMLGRSVRAVDRLAASGVLRRVRLPGQKHAAGFLAHEVETLLTAGGGE
jgi:hypothetical protein